MIMYNFFHSFKTTFKLTDLQPSLTGSAFQPLPSRTASATGLFPLAGASELTSTLQLKVHSPPG